MRDKKPSAKMVNKSQTSGESRQPKEKSRERYVLKLYISGMTLRSTLALRNIQFICKEYLPDSCDLEIIDIFEHPAKAREAQIFAAPTLIKKLPLPMHRLIGDMSQTEKVLAGLDYIGNMKS